jgi:hypothetical protein
MIRVYPYVPDDRDFVFGLAPRLAKDSIGGPDAPHPLGPKARLSPRPWTTTASSSSKTRSPVPASPCAASSPTSSATT